MNLFLDKLFQFTYLTCGQREVAEEVAQETLQRSFRIYINFVSRSTFAPGLFGLHAMSVR